jgi:hypothetical protein
VTERKLKWWGAAAATVFALLVYTRTMAPTVSFWDCGEYIAAGKILGVPHPPGMSLHHVLARLSIILFVWFQDVGARVNWISCLASSLIAGTAFLVGFRGIRMFQSNAERERFLWVAALGGAVGALLVTFCDTLWFSSVEAEMYTPAMFFTLFSVYLMLEWRDLRGTPWADKILVFVVYLSFLGVNFTLFTVMFLPILCIWVVAVDESKRRLYPLYIAGTLLMSIIYMPGLFPLIALGLAVVSTLLWLFPIMGQKEGWKLSGVLSFAAVLGWSLYLYIPVRASLTPIIDEGDPQVRKPLVVGDPSTYDNLQKRPTFSDAFDLGNWGEFREYVERKQYGSENMIVRSLTRRGNFLNQLMVHENMGYGGYLVQEFTPFKVQRSDRILGIKIPSQISVIGVESNKGEDGVYSQVPGWVPKRVAQLAIFLLAHLPLWWLFRFGWHREKRLAVLLAGLYIFSSFGMLWYVNFADGTRPEVAELKAWEQAKAAGQESEYPGPVHMEVRERDYFFTPAFVMVAILYGMAAALYAQKMRANRSDNWRKHPQFVSYLALVALMPIVAGASNWHENDRHYNWVPFDYSYNLLNSCEPNGILFTNGDNDTFPLWALQYAYGIRPDVRLVNLSLINTDWYIRQMKNLEPKVPISYTDAEIRALDVDRNPFGPGTVVDIGPRKVRVPSNQELPWIKIQDRLVLHIVQTNDHDKVHKPIHFAATVGEENMMGLAPFCKMEGMVFTLTDSIQTDPVDIDKTIRLFTQQYRFRGMGGDQYSVGYLDDDTRRLETNYSSIAIQAALGSADIAKKWRDSAALTKDSAVARELRAKAKDRVVKVASLIRAAEHLVPAEWRTAYFAAQMFATLGQPESADSVINVARKRLPNEPMLDRAAAEVANRSGHPEKAAKVLEESVRRHPGDGQLQVDLAMTYANMGSLEQALVWIKKASVMSPGDARLQQVAAQIQERADQISKMKGLPAPSNAPVPKDPGAK